MKKVCCLRDMQKLINARNLILNWHIYVLVYFFRVVLYLIGAAMYSIEAEKFNYKLLFLVCGIYGLIHVCS